MPTTMSIPVIDIAGYLDGSDKMGVAAKIGEACQDIGFFMIRGHGEQPMVFNLPIRRLMRDISLLCNR